MAAGSHLRRLTSAPPAARTIPGRLAALVAFALAALLLVGAVVLALQVRQQQAVDRLVAFREVLSRQQDAGTMPDAIRAEVYAALTVAGEPQRLQAARAALGDYQQRAERSFLDNRADLSPYDTDAQVLAALRQAAGDLDRLATVGQTAIALLRDGDDRAAAAALTRFDTRFRVLERDMADLSGRLTAAGEEAEAAADAAGGRAGYLTAVVSAMALLVVAGLGWVTWRSVVWVLRDKAATEADLREMMDRTAAEARRHAFGADLADAFDMAGTEQGAHQVVARALDAAVPDSPAELLLADSSQAGLARVVEHPGAAAPGCPVGSPWECVAVRRGRTQEFVHGAALNACPHLSDRPRAPVSAVCVPVTFMGRPLGVLHATGPAGRPPRAEAAERLGQIAAQAGARIGTLRATRKTELQAATDSLTGLLNRRSMESAVERLLRVQTPFAIAMADLDHFKQLNDTYGHEVGDRALRMFANLLRSQLRSSDIVARHGGEEFVVVLPDLSMLQATVTLDRLRERLAEASQHGGTPRFTVSFGLADTTDGAELDEILRVADGRLRAAKRLGRNRVVASDS